MKGAAFERLLCTKLSLWWTQYDEEARDDVFWRTSQSGGRATTRAKKGKKTKGHCGDICATDPIGQPLIDAITIEAKRGYSKHTIHDIIDKPKKAAKQEWEKWIEQAKAAMVRAGSRSWMIVAARNRRKEIVVVPMTETFWIPYVVVFNYGLAESPSASFTCDGEQFYVLLLDDFLRMFDPRSLQPRRSDDE